MAEIETREVRELRNHELDTVAGGRVRAILPSIMVPPATMYDLYQSWADLGDTLKRGNVIVFVK